MGSNGSKPNSETLGITVKNENDGDNSDPRSPTPEISRTPFQNKPGAKHNITKNVDLRKTFEGGDKEEKLIHNNPILSAVIKNHLQSFDPRSPTQDFVRTPIVIGLKGNESPDVAEETCASPQLKTDSDNCDSCSEAAELSPELIVPKNLCNGFYDLSLNEEPLGSSTASNDAIEPNITNESHDKPTQLLETNFDYVETEDQFEDSKEDHGENSANYESINNIPVFKILDVDPRSPSIGIDRTPIVVAKTDESSGDNVEEMSDDSLIKALQNTNAELRQSVHPMKNSDGLLIYEDETTNLNDTPKKSKSISNSGSRTPLSCMKNKDSNHARSKSVNTLYDPKNQKMSKIPKRVSHIPRLKSLSKPIKLVPTTVSSISLKNLSKPSSIGGDCENTPPHSHRDKWDKDNSIVL